MKKKAGVIAGRPHAGGGKDKAVGATGDNGDVRKIFLLVLYFCPVPCVHI